MRHQARLQAVAEILDALEGSATPSDVFLDKWARAHRYAGSKDRKAIFAQVYKVLRNKRRLCHALEVATPNGLMLALAALICLDDIPAQDAVALADGSPYAPLPSAPLPWLCLAS